MSDRTSGMGQLCSSSMSTHTRCIKKCPKYKIASELDICKITDNQQQPTANIGHRVCISVNFVFISSISLAGEEFKMLNFQVACAQKFQTKNNFFWRCQQIWNVVINL